MKKAIGNVTDDAELRAAGEADKSEGTLQNAIGGAKDAVRDALKSAVRAWLCRKDKDLSKGWVMGTILIIVIIVLLLGGGGGYYAHGRYGGAGLGGVLGLVVLVLVLLWLFGGLGGTGRI